jgi:hypothetical protein
MPAESEALRMGGLANLYPPRVIKTEPEIGEFGFLPENCCGISIFGTREECLFVQLIE